MPDDLAPLSRRAFVASLAGTGVAGAVTLTAGPTLLGSLPETMTVGRLIGPVPPQTGLAHGSYEEWLRQVGSIFTTAEGQALRLSQVSALVSPGSRPAEVTRQRAFIARFDVLGGGFVNGNRIHKLSHARGRLDVFLSAVGEAASASRLTAVFN